MEVDMVEVDFVEVEMAVFDLVAVSGV